MKILIFSDTHLYLHFDQKKFNFLKKIINKSDQVIINGDFFDDYIVSFNDFICSPWNQLFPLLKKRGAIYIYGNHDQEKYSDKRTGLFSAKQTAEYRMEINNITYIFTHGQQFRKTPDLYIKKPFKPVVSFFVKIAHFIRQNLVNIFGRNLLRFRFAYRNGAIKKKAIKTIKVNEFIIIGHNHWAEVDKKNRFACCGAILYGYAQYLTIDSSAEITLHEEWYDR